VPELTSSLSETRRQILHARLADTIEKRSRFAKTIEKRGTEEFFVIQHLLEAGFRERALDLSLKCFETLRPHLLQNQQAFDAYVQSLPKNWIETFETLLQACEELGRPKKERFSLETALVALDSVGVSANQAHLGSVLSQLYHDSGLGDYQRLDASLAPPDRISRALQIAQERYDASSAAERVNPPLEAMGFLAQNIISALSIGATSFDCSFIASLPSLEPLIPVSTAFMVIDKHVQSTFYLTAARMEESRKGYLEVLELLNKPDRGGIDETYYEYARLTAMYAAGLIEASLGMRSALRWLDTFEAYPFFQANGVRIRMVYYLRQGDTKKAEECKKRLELLQIQNSPSQIFAGGYLLPEVLVYSSSDDLNGISQTLDGIQNMATRFKTWKPILLYARGEYQRVRGDYQKSLSELQEALSLVKPGQHVIWPYLASAYIGTLCDVENFQQARDLGREFLAAALEFGLGISSNLIARSLSLAEGALGEYDTAVQRLQSAIEQYEQAEITGLSPGLVYETRARLAIMMADTPGFSHFARQCAEQYQPGHNPALTAKYEKLMHEAARATLRVSDDLAHAADFYDLTTATAVTLVTGFLGDCRGPKERADRALELLVEQSHCIGGFLYTLQKQGPVLVAQNGVTTVPAEMDAMVVSYLAAEMEDVGGITLSSDTIVKSVEETSQWTVAQREQYRPLVLGHLSNDGYRITGLAVLVRDPARLFAVPGDAVTALSKSLFDAGDVTALVATG
jgi:tetratricopeptide (TPR) repeat protein